MNNLETVISDYRIHTSANDSINVLVIDDDTICCHILDRHFSKKHNHNIKGISCPSEALEYVKKNYQSLNAIILDYNFNADLTGIDLLRILKSSPETQNIPIVMLSSLEDQTEITRCLEFGAYYFVKKPIQIGYLNAVLNSAIEMDLSSKRPSVAPTESLLAQTNSMSIKFNTLKEILLIADYFSHLPNIKQEVVKMGLFKLLSNALEFGIYNLSSIEKDKLIEECKLASKLNLGPKSHQSYGEISFLKDKNLYEFTIRDFGKGFEYKKYVSDDIVIEKNRLKSGILWCQKFCFESLEYKDNGSTVIAKISQRA